MSCQSLTAFSWWLFLHSACGFHATLKIWVCGEGVHVFACSEGGVLQSFIVHFLYIVDRQGRSYSLSLLLLSLKEALTSQVQ